MRPELSDIVLDQVERSVEAGSAMIVLDIRESEGRLDIFLSDNGKELDEKLLQTLKDDFQTGEKPEDSVGGLVKIKDLCDRTGGTFAVESGAGTGTSLHIGFNTGHPESPAIEDLPEMFTYCMIFDGDYELVVNRFYNDKKYSAVRSEIYRSFGDLNDSRTIALLQKFFDGFEEEIHGETRS